MSKARNYCNITSAQWFGAGYLWW